MWKIFSFFGLKSVHFWWFLFQDVKYTDLEYLVKFIYSGEVVVPRDQVQDVLNTGELLQIKGWSFLDKLN